MVVNAIAFGVTRMKRKRFLYAHLLQNVFHNHFSVITFEITFLNRVLLNNSIIKCNKAHLYKSIFHSCLEKNIYYLVHIEQPT